MSEPVDAVANPPEGKEDVLLEHEYDGIREYDNPLPRWWVSIFWVSILFAGLYFFHFHITHQGTSVRESYEAEVKAYEEAEAKRALKEKVTEESLQKLAANSQATSAGAEVFRAQCVPCHGDQAQGVIGPNLTDRAWIHGRGTLMDIYDVVATGVAAKGMPAWRRQLSPMELRQVVAFVGTLRNTMVEGKAPEGQVVQAVEGDGASDAQAAPDRVSATTTEASRRATDAGPAAPVAAETETGAKLPAEGAPAQQGDAVPAGVEATRPTNSE